MLEMRRVTKTYEGEVPVQALRNLTLEIPTGSFVAIMGPSGSGKSTLLNVLGLLDHPSDGRYLIGGVDTADLSEAELSSTRADTFGFVFQEFHLIPGRSVLANVELGMLYGSTSRNLRRDRALGALARVGMDTFWAADPRVLSGGERQRVAIARGIASGAPVLLCDEPTGNLDSANTHQLMTLLLELNTAGQTVIVVTHDDEVASYAGRVIHLRDGSLVETVS